MMGASMVRIIFVSLLLIMAVPYAQATFISPGGVKLDFEPNLQKDLVFIVGGAPRVNVSIHGELAEYARIIDTKKMETGTLAGGTQVTVRISLPEHIPKPGEHKISVVASEIAEEGAMISSAVVVGAPIRIFVPYPGKYVDVSFSVKNINENDTAEFVFKTVSYCTDNVTEAWGHVEVFDAKGGMIAAVDSEKASIATRERKSFTAEWVSVGYPAGNYHAEGTFYWDDNMTVSEADFRIGNMNIHILNFTRELEAGKINPFDVLVESGWNSNAESVYAVVSIAGVTMQTPSVDLAAWERKELGGYFDAADIEPGTYTADIVLHYHGRRTEAAGEVAVVKAARESILEQPMLVYGGLVSLIVSLLILGLALFVLLRRKAGKEGR
jgi:hypothetical protein